MTPRLKKIIIIGVIAIIVMAVLGVLLNVWTTRKMDKVSLGLARPDFPYTDYTESELAEMYPQIKYADVATRTTPEETYAKFRQALKDNNLEMAIEQLSKESGKYKENKEALTKAYGEGGFDKIYEFYPGDAWRGTFGESSGQLCYNQKHEDGEFVGCSYFIKDANGDWKLDSL